MQMDNNSKENEALGIATKVPLDILLVPAMSDEGFFQNRRKFIHPTLPSLPQTFQNLSVFLPRIRNSG